MKLIYGFDLGPTSIGWAIVREKENDTEKSEIVKLGVRVIPLSVDEKNNFEKGKPITTNADRRLRHGMRLNLSRYKQRRANLKFNLERFGFISKDTVLCEDGTGTTFETLRLRAKAATEEVSLEDFARILLMINKKRGYKSARKIESDDGVAVDSLEIAKILNKDNITPGEYVNNTMMQQNKKFIPQFYRSDLINEFNRIWDVQSQYFPELNDELKDFVLHKGVGEPLYTALNAQDFKPVEIRDKKIHYRLRADAVKHKLNAEELVPVLKRIRSEINNSSALLGAISDRSKELYFSNITIGQYLWNKIKDNPNKRLKGATTFYRQDYEDEFNRIWETQKKFHKELTDDLKKQFYHIIFFQRQLKKQRKSICEFERQEKEIIVDGKSKTIEIGPTVCPKSSPIFQEFRLWQTINNITLTGLGDDPRDLTEEERQVLFKELSIRASMSASDILKSLKLNSRQWSLNFSKVQGNTTLATLYDAYKEIVEQSGHDNNDFAKATYDQTILVIKPVFNALGINTDILGIECPIEQNELNTDPVYQLWHLLYSYAGDKSRTGNDALIEKLCQRYGFIREYASILANKSFEQEYGNLSAKAMMKILPFLRKGEKYSDACKDAGYNHSVRSLTRAEIDSKTLSTHIDLLPRNSLRQPVVEKILNQLINITNELIATYGNPDEIRVELARELKKSAEERGKLSKSISDNEKDNGAIRKKLIEKFHIQYPSRNDIIRYKLYQELEYTGYKTLYSQQHITEDNLFGKEIEIEHIIPQSRFFDDSLANKTLEFHKINQDKSNDTAYDYINKAYGSDGASQYKNRVDDLLKHKKISRKKHKYLLMTSDKIPNDFINRDICETQYISRKAMEILEPVTRRVVATTGSITTRLREDWQLVNVMKELNFAKYEKLGLTETITDKDGRRISKITDWTKRNDHRHHAMDALTVAFTKQSFIQYLNSLNARNDKDSVTYSIQQKELSRNNDGRLCFNPPMPLNEFRAEAKRQIDSILVSHKAKNKVATWNVNTTKCKGKGKDKINKKLQQTPRGELHNATIYGRILRYSTREVAVDSKLTAEIINTVADKSYREALLKRLLEFGGNPSTAFTLKNSITKNPIYVDDNHTIAVPGKVKTVELVPVLTKRVSINESINISDVLDSKIKDVLIARQKAYVEESVAQTTAEFNNDKSLNPDEKDLLINKFLEYKNIKGYSSKIDKDGSLSRDFKSRIKKKVSDYREFIGKAFTNLEENPIWINKEKGICVKKVKIAITSTSAIAIHCKRDNKGNYMHDKNGNLIPTDYTDTNNNHHFSIYRDSDGRYQEQQVTFIEAVGRKINNQPIIDRNFNADKGWQFLFSIKKNEYFVFPNEETSFNPSEIDLLNPDNFATISPNLFRVQKISSKYYTFRHHLETTVSEDNKLLGTTWKRITSLKALSSIVKVRVNNVGQIVAVGEY